MDIKNNKQGLGYIEGWLSISVNTVLFGLKIWAGMMTGLIAMIADAWHTLSDSLTSVILLVGVKIFSKKPDKQHPYGHGRAESIAAIIIATLLFIVGINFLKESFLKINADKTLNLSKPALYIFIFSALIKEALARFAIRAGKKTDSDVLKADGWHHRSDAITTAIIVAAFFLCNKYRWLDGLLGLFVSGFIIYAAYEIIKDASKSILGSGMSEKNRREICDIVNDRYPRIEDAHHFHIHRYGEHRELTMHIFMAENLFLKTVHDIIEKLENEIYERFGIDTTIHADYRHGKN